MEKLDGEEEEGEERQANFAAGRRRHRIPLPSAPARRLRPPTPPAAVFNHAIIGA